MGITKVRLWKLGSYEAQDARLTCAAAPLNLEIKQLFSLITQWLEKGRLNYRIPVLISFQSLYFYFFSKQYAIKTSFQ